MRRAGELLRSGARKAPPWSLPALSAAKGMDSQGEEFRTASLVGSVHPQLPPPQNYNSSLRMVLSVLLRLPDCFVMANGLTSSYITSSLLVEVSLFRSVVCARSGFLWSYLREAGACCFSSFPLSTGIRERVLHPCQLSWSPLGLLCNLPSTVGWNGPRPLWWVHWPRQRLFLT